jgi:hypothetical protein
VSPKGHGNECWARFVLGRVFRSQQRLSGPLVRLVLQLPSLQNDRVVLSPWFLGLLWRMPRGQDVDLHLDSILLVGSARAWTYPLLLLESDKDYKNIEECLKWVFLLSPGSANDGRKRPTKTWRQ